ncbi:hypothetical protein BH11MYX1_BH11MYX1_10500 [soil metagenome]
MEFVIEVRRAVDPAYNAEMGRSWLVVLCAAGCYHPTLQLGEPCTAEGECPSGQMCASDRCVATGTQSDAAVILDAPGNLDAMLDAPADAPPPPSIMFVSEKDTKVPAAAPVTAIVIANPQCPAGAVMIGAIAMGVSGATANPSLTAPQGWALVRRLDHSFDLALAVYIHIAGPVEPLQHVWTMSNISEGVAWIACYLNVDPANPIVDNNGVVTNASGPGYLFPSVVPDVPRTMILGIVAGHGGSMATWTPPTGTTERIDIQDGTTRSGALVEHLDLGTGATAMLAETASVAQDYALLEVIALRPKP